jgi:sugar lactone lactonase YvrE
LGNHSVKSITLATQSGDFSAPLDSTPGLDATTIYFTASSSHGPGVFRVPAAGGAVTAVFAGSPFLAPRGIAISPDGQQLYVADPMAGKLFMLPTSGGSPSLVQGSGGTAPQNLDVVNQGGQLLIYFTGKDPSSGQAAVFELALSGAKGLRMVVKGAPLVAPDGIVVTRSGVIYVSDRAAASGGLGSVFKIDGSKVTVIVDRVRTGNPAGIALTRDESILLVSALQPTSPSAQLLLVDLSTGHTGSVTKVIAQNRDAGGLHASPGKNNFLSWCDRSVYAIEV